jgi:hypothetical protein
LKRSVRDFFEVDDYDAKEEDDDEDDDDDDNNDNDNDDDNDDDDDDDDNVPQLRRKRQNADNGDDDGDARDNDDYNDDDDNNDKHVPQARRKRQKVDQDDVYKVDNDSGQEFGTSDEEEVLVCMSCGATPCDWAYYQDDIIKFARNNHFFVNHRDPQDPYSFLTEKFLTMMDEEKKEMKTSHQEYKKKCFRHYTFLK